jgi:Ca-activated chloride channel family protein
LMSLLLVVRERWPDTLVQRFFKQKAFLPSKPEWRQRLKNLRRRR